MRSLNDPDPVDDNASVVGSTITQYTPVNAGAFFTNFADFSVNNMSPLTSAAPTTIPGSATSTVPGSATSTIPEPVNTPQAQFHPPGQPIGFQGSMGRLMGNLNQFLNTPSADDGNMPLSMP